MTRARNRRKKSRICTEACSVAVLMSSGCKSKPMTTPVLSTAASGCSTVTVKRISVLVYLNRVGVLSVLCAVVVLGVVLVRVVGIVLAVVVAS